MRPLVIFWLTTLLVESALAQASWYLDDVAACKTISGLIAKYNAKNIKARDTIKLDGDRAPRQIIVTRLFPNTPDQLTIYWVDATKLVGIRSIQGEIYTSPDRNELDYKKPKWKTRSGLHYNMAISDVIALNEKDFTLYGLEWDYAGLVCSWQSGKLAKTKAGAYFGMKQQALLDESDTKTISGDEAYASSLPAWKKASIVKLTYPLDMP